MTFSEILTEARRLVKATTVSYPTTEITSSANKALERVVTLIREAEGRWEWDDSNNTDLPIATATLTTDQQDYSFDATHYRIARIEVKDTSGNWHLLKSIDQADIFDQALTEFLATHGLPQYYDKIGNSLFLYPKPSYTQAASLKVYYERGPSYFATSDTTKEPGFNKLFHALIPMWCAFDYALINSLPVVNTLRGEIEVWEQRLQEFYGFRSRDEHPKMSARSRRYSFR